MANRKRTGTKPPKAVDAILETGKQSRRRRLIILFTVVFVVIGLAVSLSIYFIQVRPLQRPILKVNDTEISIGYLIRRMEGVGTNDISAMMMTLVNEELVRQAALRLGIEISDEEMDETLHDFARGENESIADAEFQKWYRDRLNESRLTDTEFREFWRTILAGGVIQELEAARVPTVTEQIRLSYIVTDDHQAALDAHSRLEEGEAFAEVAADVSIDPAAAENGADWGWFPEAALPDRIRFAFGLAVGEYYPPVSLSDEDDVFAIFLATDRAASREVDDDKLAMVRARAMDAWLLRESGLNDVTYHGMDWSETAGRYAFGSKTQAWIMWQLAKRGSVNAQAGQ